MSKATGAIRENDFGAAERALAEVQHITTKLMKEVGEKARSAMQTPDPDASDRG
jgi:hypothetical protein